MTNIVMLCQDRYRLLKQSLDSLYAHTPREDFNLTLVDDGSTDFRAINLLENTAANESNCCLVRVRASGNSLSKLKNWGVTISASRFGRADGLYLSDSDVHFTCNWLTTLTELADRTEQEGFRLWGGQIHPFHAPINNPPIYPDMTEHSVLDGPSWLMSWRTWEDVGGFVETPAVGACQSEEYPICWDILHRGGRIGVTNPHVVIHTGLTQSNGQKAPGWEIREANKVPGVLYL